MSNATRTVVSTDKAPKAIGPYSQAIVANGFVFCSGQIALDPKTGQLVRNPLREPGGELSIEDAQLQTRQVMENLRAVLEAAGSGLDRVVKTTIYLKRMSDFAAVNEVYAKYFPAAPPARATVEVSRLPRDVLVEIDMIALAAS